MIRFLNFGIASRLNFRSKIHNEFRFRETDCGDGKMNFYTLISQDNFNTLHFQRFKGFYHICKIKRKNYKPGNYPKNKQP